MRHKVIVADIERELEEEHKGRVTAALFNLVVHVQDIEHAHDAVKTIHQVLQRFPCRVIFLTEDPDAKHDYFNLEVTAEPVGGVSCDQIYLSFAGKEREKVPFVVLPHLLPDLPIYLLWTGDPAPDDVIFPTLEQHTSRILLDPDTLHNLPDYSRFVLMLMRSSVSSVSDIHWALIDGWRHIIREVLSPDLPIKSLVITYNQMTSGLREDPRLGAAYLQGWLASRLGWTNPQKSDNIITYSDQTVELLPIEMDLQQGAIASVTIASHTGVTLEMTLHKNRVRVDVTTPEKCDLPYTLPLSFQDKEDALVREIFRKETSHHYESTLELLSKIAWS